MEKIINRILLICFGLLVISVVSLIVYKISINIDQTNCIKKLALQFDVAPTYGEVYNAIYREINSKLPIGLSYKESVVVLNKNWNYKIIWRSPSLEYGYSEYIELSYCSYSMNDYSFLFMYSKDDKLTEIIKYIDD